MCTLSKMYCRVRKKPFFIIIKPCTLFTINLTASEGEIYCEVFCKRKLAFINLQLGCLRQTSKLISQLIVTFRNRQIVIDIIAVCYQWQNFSINVSAVSGTASSINIKRNKNRKRGLYSRDCNMIVYGNNFIIIITKLSTSPYKIL